MHKNRLEGVSNVEREERQSGEEIVSLSSFDFIELLTWDGSFCMGV
ncbi:hypothetical protein IH992_07240 [Candidatus Poribacteria bacterium]|nr:hypothetical protein [Candidatus Poribacteria bacterium]